MKNKLLKGDRTLVSVKKHEPPLPSGRKRNYTIYLLLSPSNYVLWEAYDLTDLCQQLEYFFNVSVYGETPRKRFNKIIKLIEE